MVRGRRYPWGEVNIEDPAHCDFLNLRSFILSKHMQDMKDVTDQVYYERYRRRKLASMTEEESMNHGLNFEPLSL